MNSATLDRIARALASGVSRRSVILGTGAALSGISRLGNPGYGTAAQTGPTPTPASETRPVFPPIYVSTDTFPIDIPIVPFPNPEGTPAAEGTPGPLGPEGTPEPLGPGATPGAPESLCGLIDESQHVERYDGTLGVGRDFVDAHQPPVGNIRWNADLWGQYDDPGNVNGVHWCSGTLIANDLFLTAGHCFSQEPSGWRVPRINGTASPISRGEIATHMHVAFNYQVGPDGFSRAELPVPVIDLLEVQEVQLGGLDYAIVRLAHNPGPDFPPARVAVADAPQGSTISIIGHPRGLHKKIEAGAASQYQGHNLYYNDIDTDGGSSGSGLLSSAEGAIVGIHTNGGCAGVAAGNNFGFRISSLLAASPTLASLAGT